MNKVYNIYITNFNFKNYEPNLISDNLLFSTCGLQKMERLCPENTQLEFFFI